MRTREVELARLSPPETQSFANPDKVAKYGAFDWNKYVPIIVEQDGERLIVQEGMTRVEMRAVQE